VSTFNNPANEQGTGRTIVQISPSGKVTAFARIPNVPGIAVAPQGSGLYFVDDNTNQLNLLS
jgi:hypothetical protein